MELNKDTVRELHAQIDRERDEQIARAKEDARHKHESLNITWAMVQRGVTIPTTATTSSPRHASEDIPAVASERTYRVEHRPDRERKIFPTRDAIVEIIEGLDEETDITQPMLFDILHERHEEIRRRDSSSVRGQIPSILRKLVEKGIVYLHTPGHGQVPSIWRKTAQGGLNSEPAVRATGSLLPAMNHKEDLPVR